MVARLSVKCALVGERLEILSNYQFLDECGVRFLVAFVTALVLCVVLTPVFRAFLPSPTWELTTFAVAVLIPKLAIGRS